MKAWVALLVNRSRTSGSPRNHARGDGIATSCGSPSSLQMMPGGDSSFWCVCVCDCVCGCGCFCSLISCPTLCSGLGALSRSWLSKLWSLLGDTYYTTENPHEACFSLAVEGLRHIFGPDLLAHPGTLCPKVPHTDQIRLTYYSTRLCNTRTLAG